MLLGSSISSFKQIVMFILKVIAIELMFGIPKFVQWQTKLKGILKLPLYGVGLVI